jgi:hypothetical protein
VYPYDGSAATIEGGRSAVVLDKVCGRPALPDDQCSDLDLSAMALHYHRPNPFHHCRLPRAMGKRGFRSHASRKSRRMRLRAGTQAQNKAQRDARHLKNNWETARDWAHNHARPAVVPFLQHHQSRVVQPLVSWTDRPRTPSATRESGVPVCGTRLYGRPGSPLRTT